MHDDAQTCANAPSGLEADAAGGGIVSRGQKDTQVERRASLKMKRGAAESGTGDRHAADAATQHSAATCEA
eukprot:1376088-Pleurochrysis_carterae.AAC.2